MHGKGTYKWGDGSYYRGKWLNNLFNGQGEYIWPNGRKYKGGWVNGK